jgi:hypothetical protein
VPTPILADADRFEFTSLQGESLDLFGALVSWNDEIDTGIVEKQVVKRMGAIHQNVGGPPKRFDFRCVYRGLDVRVRYLRVVDVALQQPEGLLVHPRFGRLRAVFKSISAAENPGDAKDTIEFTIKFAETGLKDPPKPAPSAKAAAGMSAVANLVQKIGNALPSELQTGRVSNLFATLAGTVQSRATGFLVAMQQAESGLGTLLDVDASLAALIDSVSSLEAQSDAPKAGLSACYLAMSYAIQSRNRFIAGRPPLIEYVLQSPESLGGLCQRLYGSRGRDEQALTFRLNRIARPYLMPVGQRLVLSDPSLVA